MASRTPETRAADGNDLQIRHLIGRLGMINRIHTALRFTLNVDDIHSIILTTMISRSGLDFSRAFLIGFDEVKHIFRGLAALGAATREEHERLRREIGEEEQCLAGMAAELAELESAREEETLFTHGLRELSDHSFWITMFQKFSSHNQLQEVVRQVEICCASGDPPACRFLKDILDGDSAQIVAPRKLSGSGLPQPLVGLFEGPSLWKSIRTRKGVRLILIVDRIFDPNPLTELDVLHVDWVVSQVALALENAEMYQNLEVAYNSLRDLDRMKTGFLATISHELRTPLTAINGYVQLMLGDKIGPLSAGQREVLERIHAHSDLLTGKVNDLIEIAEMDAGRPFEMGLEPVDPLAAVLSALPRVEPRRAQKGVVIEPVLNQPIPRVRGNQGSLERILYHLIDNAVKFGHPHGRVWIEFEILGGDLQIHISDDGIGISQNQLRKIFESFYQVDNRLTRNYEGLGIGLAIIKKQLDYTAGRIQVQSRPGRGSTFTIIYPLAEGEKASPNPAD